MLTVTIENPSLPPGTLLEVKGLGAFKNGEAKEISPELEQHYLASTGRTIQSLDQEPYYVVSGGETLFQGSSTPPVDSLGNNAGEPEHEEGSEN